MATVAVARDRPTTIALPGDRTYPESITSTRDGTIFVGNLGEGGIYRIRPGRTEAEAWIKPGAFGSRSILGVLADERSHTLWACSNDLTFMGLGTGGTDTGTTLKGFDLTSGAGKVSFALPGEHSVCNDIAIGPDGSAYVTDAIASYILRLPPGGKQLEVWFADPALKPPERSGGIDGIAFDDDGAMYVSVNGQQALYRIAIANGAATGLTKLRTSRALDKPDAIRPLGHHRFLLIENGGKLSSFTVRGDDTAVETLKDGLDVPTGAAIAGRQVWVSEGKLNYVFDPSMKGKAPPLPFRLYAVDLPK